MYRPYEDQILDEYTKYFSSIYLASNKTGQLIAKLREAQAEIERLTAGQNIFVGPPKTIEEHDRALNQRTHEDLNKRLKVLEGSEQGPRWPTVTNALSERLDALEENEKKPCYIVDAKGLKTLKNFTEQADLLEACYTELEKEVAENKRSNDKAYIDRIDAHDALRSRVRTLERQMD